MNNRLFDTAHNSSAQQRARIQTQRIHTQDLMASITSESSSDLRVNVLTALIRKTEEMAAVEVQS